MVSIRIRPCDLRQAASPLGPVPCPWGLGVRGSEDSLMCLPSSTLQDYFWGSVLVFSTSAVGSAVAEQGPSCCDQDRASTCGGQWAVSGGAVMEKVAASSC